MRKVIYLILSFALVLLALPYLSSGVSVFMGKWAYDWGLPVPVIKLILLAVAAVVLLAIFSLVKKAFVVLVVAVLVMVGLNALGLYNMRTDPKDIVAQISSVAADNSETIVTATKDLFYQTVAYVSAVNPVESLVDFASGEDSFWYVAKSDEEVDFTQEIFKGYTVAEVKEAGDFKAYHLAKSSDL